MLEILLANIFKELNNPGDGSIYDSYKKLKKLLASDGKASHYFGSSLAITENGSTIVVGVFGDNDKGAQSGAAYIFTKQANGSYLETQKLLALDGGGIDAFGHSVAITPDGSTIVVGAHQDDNKGAYSGSAYIFKKQANGSYLQHQKLLASDGAANDWFGYRLAITGDSSTVLVGVFSDDDKGANSGSAYIFTKQAGGGYLQTQKLLASDGATYDYFGCSVAISTDGSTIVIGAHQYGNTGRIPGYAYIFAKQANGSYLETQKLLADDGVSGDRFGYSVAISGDGSTIVIGAQYGNNNKGFKSGSAYIYTRDPDGSYYETQELLASDGAADDQFGYSVDITEDGSTIIIGTPGYEDLVKDKGDVDSGSVYIFTKQADGSYKELQKLVPFIGDADAYFGFKLENFGASIAIASKGSTIVVGANGDNAKGSMSGSAYVFSTL